MLKMFKNLRDPEKLLKALVLFGLFLLVVIVFAQKIEFSAVDLGRHLENGRLVFENRDVLFKNFYSYTEPETRFINHHWLAGVIFYAVYFLGGFKLLSLFNILLAVLTFFAFFKLAQKKASFLIAAILAIPIIFLFSERVEIRPEIFSYLFLALTWLVLENKNFSRKKRLFILIPLFVLWANIHIYFFIGLILIALKLIEKFLLNFVIQLGEFKKRAHGSLLAVKSQIIDFLLIIVVCIITPNHIFGLLYPLNIFKNYGYQIAENKSIFFLDDLMLNYNFQIFKLVLILLLISFISTWFFTKKIRWFNSFLGLFFSLFALFASRNIALFGLVALVLIGAGIYQPLIFLKSKFFIIFPKFSGFRRWYIFVLVISFIFFVIIYFIADYSGRHNFLKGEFGLGLRIGSEDSFQFFKDNGVSGPIFNNYDAGSALIFGLAPTQKVFVDNRPEAYSSRFFTEIYLPMQQNEGQWKKYLEQYKFKTVYFSYTDSTPWGREFLTRILQDKDWTLIYFDRYYVILSFKSNTSSEILNKYAIDTWKFRSRLRELSDNSDFKSKFNLADLAQSFGQPDLAGEIYNQIMIAKPRNGRAVLSLAYLYANSSNRESLLKSIDYFIRSLKIEENTPGVYSRLALVYWQLADYKNAQYYWHQAKKINRHDVDALYYLNQVEDLKKSGELPLN
ncbi:MAG: hypothetical protein WCT50_03670 [Patescibacteria group bacterium]